MARRRSGRIERVLRDGAGAGPAGSPGVRDVRVLGAIGVIELERSVDVAAASAAAVARGVWLRPFRNLVYAMPPYVSGDEELRQRRRRRWWPRRGRPCPGLAERPARRSERCTLHS